MKYPVLALALVSFALETSIFAADSPVFDLGQPNDRGIYTIDVDGKKLELEPALIVVTPNGVVATPLSKLGEDPDEESVETDSFSITHPKVTTLGAELSTLQGAAFNIGIGWIIRGYGYTAESAFIEVQPGLAGQMLSVGYQKLTEFGMFGGAISARASYYFTTSPVFKIDSGQQYAGGSLSATVEVFRLTGGLLLKTKGTQGPSSLIYIGLGVGF